MEKLSINSENIETLIAAGVAINKYEDPTEGARTNLTAEEATEVAREDASLLWVDLDQVIVNADFGDCYPVLEEGLIADVISGEDATLCNGYAILGGFWAITAEELYHRLGSEEFAVVDRETGDNMANARIRAAWDTLHVYNDDVNGYSYMDGDEVASVIAMGGELIPAASFV